MPHDSNDTVLLHKLLHIAAQLITGLIIIGGHHCAAHGLIHGGVCQHQPDSCFFDLLRICCGLIRTAGAEHDSVRLRCNGVQNHLVLRIHLTLIFRTHDSQIHIIFFRCGLPALIHGGPEIRIIQSLLYQHDIQRARRVPGLFPVPEAAGQHNQGRAGSQKHPCPFFTHFQLPSHPFRPESPR